MKILKSAIFIILMIVTSACSLMLPDRSFIEEMERENEAFYSPGIDFPVVSGDTGETKRNKEEILARTPASRRSKYIQDSMASLGSELREKEAELSDGESERYRKNKSLLSTDSDKIYYLNLTPSERTSYIQAKKEDLEDEVLQKKDLFKKRSIHSSELFLGMLKSEVVNLWGKPSRVEIAGNPKNQNERWSFVEDGNVKQVYFEDGKVQGWALDL